MAADCRKPPKIRPRPTAFSDKLSPWLDVGEDMSCMSQAMLCFALRMFYCFFLLSRNQNVALGVQDSISVYVCPVDDYKIPPDLRNSRPNAEWLNFHWTINSLLIAIGLELFKLRFLCVLLRLKQHVFSLDVEFVGNMREWNNEIQGFDANVWTIGRYAHCMPRAATVPHPGLCLPQGHACPQAISNTTIRNNTQGRLS